MISNLIYHSRLAAVEFIRNLFIEREFKTTLTEENAMAPAARAGFKSQPVTGYNTPAATGMPILL
jgi:hypothetical protein